MPKRKRAAAVSGITPPVVVANARISSLSQAQTAEVADGELAQAASPDSSGLSSPPESDQGEDGGFMPEPEVALTVPKKKKAGAGKKAAVVRKKTLKGEGEDGEFVDEGEGINGHVKAKQVKSKLKKAPAQKKKANAYDRMESEVQEPEERPPPVNSDYVPIPWKGRLGFACLNTYLRAANPPIFCSRTCRIDTILKQGAEGQKYVETLGLLNARDLVKLIHWNEKYGIKFLRISSEMFPFASHPVYGYSLEFAKDVLAEAGKAAMKYGHRLSMHPGQFTQFGSPRREVVENSVRDVEYHAQLLGYLGLTGQADRDAVMILHMGGTFGDREATLQRFRENYALLSSQVKARLVLENDDVCWSVHDLLPICKELNIPLVLDWHHHNITRDPSMREGTLDILQLIPEIKATWTRKGITQKQHYSEPREGAVTDKERRRHSARVVALPPCEDTMDLMIEAKDKEQAIFELMRKYKLPGWEKIQDVIPHLRDDENKPEPKKGAVKTKKPKKSKKATREKCADEDERGQAEDPVPESEPELAVPPIAEDDIGMGGTDCRVYWPEGKEEWLSPAKRVRVKKVEGEENRAVNGAEEGGEADGQKPKRAAKRSKKNGAVKTKAKENVDEEVEAAPPAKKARRSKKALPTADDITIPQPAPAKATRKKKTAVVKTEDTITEVTTRSAPAASGKRKSTTVKKKSISVARVDEAVPSGFSNDIVDGDSGKRRSTRAMKAVEYVEYVELREGDIDVEAEAESSAIPIGMGL